MLTKEWPYSWNICWIYRYFFVRASKLYGFFLSKYSGFQKIILRGFHSRYREFPKVYKRVYVKWANKQNLNSLYCAYLSPQLDLHESNRHSSSCHLVCNIWRWIPGTTSAAAVSSIRCFRCAHHGIFPSKRPFDVPLKVKVRRCWI